MKMKYTKIFNVKTEFFFKKKDKQLGIEKFCM